MRSARLTYTSVSAIVACWATVAFAQLETPAPAPANLDQESSEPQSTLDDIIVTAQKRSERLSDVPLSITAVTGESMRNLGITNTSDLAKIVPGFTAVQSPYGTPLYTLRGIGFFEESLGVSPTVAVYVDQVPLPYSAMTEGAALDLERVEALKGPQGTLFGQNSTGGAINFIANKPTRHFAAGLGVGYGNFNAVNVNGFVSGPLTDDLAGRVA